MDEVLTFWFSDEARWWKKDPAFDTEIRQKFGAIHAEIERGDHEAWLETARGSLAYVIVLDQFSRNMFRDSPRAFATDARARRAAESAVAKGFDAELSSTERPFLYMPFMHSEDLADQERCCELFRAHGVDELVGYAERHRAIVARFGRFPHRNAVLGREPTAEEIEFLKQPGSSF